MQPRRPAQFLKVDASEASQTPRDETVITPYGADVIVFSPKQEIVERVNKWLQDHQRYMSSQEPTPTFSQWHKLDASEVEQPAIEHSSLGKSPETFAGGTRRRKSNDYGGHSQKSTSTAPYNQTDASEDDNMSLEFSELSTNPAFPFSWHRPPMSPSRGKTVASTCLHRSSSDVADFSESDCDQASSSFDLAPQLPPTQSVPISKQQRRTSLPEFPGAGSQDHSQAGENTVLESAEERGVAAEHPATGSSSSTWRRRRSASLPNLNLDGIGLDLYSQDTDLNETVSTPGGHSVLLFSPKLGPNAPIPVLGSTWQVQLPPALQARTDQVLSVDAEPANCQVQVQTPATVQHIPERTHGRRKRSASLPTLNLEALSTSQRYPGDAANEIVTTPGGHNVMLFSPKLAPGTEVPPMGATWKVQLPPALRAARKLSATGSGATSARSRRLSLPIVSLDTELATAASDSGFTEVLFTPKGSELCIFRPRVEGVERSSSWQAHQQPAAPAAPALSWPAYQAHEVQLPSALKQKPSGGSESSASPPVPRRRQSVTILHVQTADESVGNELVLTPSGMELCVFSPKAGEVERRALQAHQRPVAPARAVESDLAVMASWPTFLSHEVRMPAALREKSPTELFGRRRSASLPTLSLPDPYPKDPAINETVTTPCGHSVMLFSPKLAPGSDVPSVNVPWQVQLPPALEAARGTSESGPSASGSSARSRRQSLPILKIDTALNEVVLTPQGKEVYACGHKAENKLLECHEQSTVTDFTWPAFQDQDMLPPSALRRKHSAGSEQSTGSCSPLSALKRRSSAGSEHSASPTQVNVRRRQSVTILDQRGLNEVVSIPAGPELCVFSPNVEDPQNLSTWQAHQQVVANTAGCWPTFQSHEVRLPAALREKKPAKPPGRWRSASLPNLVLPDPYPEDPGINETVTTSDGHSIMLFSPKLAPGANAPMMDALWQVQLPPALQAQDGGSSASYARSRRKSLPILQMGRHRDCDRSDVRLATEDEERCEESNNQGPTVVDTAGPTAMLNVGPGVQVPAAMQQPAPLLPGQRRRSASLPALNLQGLGGTPNFDSPEVNHRVLTSEGGLLFSPREDSSADIPGIDPNWRLQVPSDPLARKLSDGSCISGSSAGWSSASSRSRRRQSMPILRIDTGLANIADCGGVLNELVTTPKGSEVCVFSPKVLELEQPAADVMATWPTFQAHEVQMPTALKEKTPAKPVGRKRSASLPTLNLQGLLYNPYPEDPELNETVTTPGGHNVMLFSPKLAPDADAPVMDSSWQVQIPPALQAARTRRRQSMPILKIDTGLGKVADGIQELNEVVTTPRGSELCIFSPKVLELEQPATDVMAIWPTFSAHEVQIPAAMQQPAPLLPGQRRRSASLPALNLQGLGGTPNFDSPEVNHRVLTSEGGLLFSPREDSSADIPGIDPNWRLQVPSDPLARKLSDGSCISGSSAGWSSASSRSRRRQSMPILRIDTGLANIADCGGVLNELVTTPKGSEVCVFSPKVLELEQPAADVMATWPTFQAHEVQMPTALKEKTPAKPVGRKRSASLPTLNLQGLLYNPYPEDPELNETVTTPGGHNVMLFSPKLAPDADAPVMDSSWQVQIPPALQAARTRRRQSMPILKIDTGLGKVADGIQELNEVVTTPRGSELCIFSPKVLELEQPATDVMAIWPTFSAHEVQIPAAMQQPAPLLPGQRRRSASLPALNLQGLGGTPNFDSPEVNHRVLTSEGGLLFSPREDSSADIPGIDPNWRLQVPSDPLARKLSDGSCISGSSAGWSSASSRSRRRQSMPILRIDTGLANIADCGGVLNELVTTPKGSEVCVFSPKVLELEQPAADVMATWPTFQAHEVQMPTALKEKTPAKPVGRKRSASLPTLNLQGLLYNPYPEDPELNETVTTPGGHNVMLFSPKTGAPDADAPVMDSSWQVQIPPALQAARTRRRQSMPILKIDTGLGKVADGIQELNEVVTTPRGSELCIFSPKVLELEQPATDVMAIWPTFSAHEVQIPAAMQQPAPLLPGQRRRSASLPALNLQGLGGTPNFDSPEVNHRVLTSEGGLLFSPREDSSADIPGIGPNWRLQVPSDPLARKLSDGSCISGSSAGWSSASSRSRRRQSMPILRIDTGLANIADCGGVLNELVTTPKGSEVCVFSPKVLELEQPAADVMATWPTFQAHEVQMPTALKEKTPAKPVGRKRSASLPTLNLQGLLYNPYPEDPELNETVTTPGGHNVMLFSPKLAPDADAPVMDSSWQVQIPPALQAARTRRRQSMPILKIDTGLGKVADGIQELNEVVTTPRGSELCIFSPKVLELEQPATDVMAIWPTFSAHEVQIPAAMQQPAPLLPGQRRRSASLPALNLQGLGGTPNFDSPEVNHRVLTTEGGLLFSPREDSSADIPGIDPNWRLQVPSDPLARKLSDGSCISGSSAGWSSASSRSRRRQSMPILRIDTGLANIADCGGVLNELVTTPKGSEVCVFSPKVLELEQPAADVMATWPTFQAHEVQMPTALKEKTPAKPVG